MMWLTVNGADGRNCKGSDERARIQVVRAKMDLTAELAVMQAVVW